MANEDVIKELPEYYAHKPVKAARYVNAVPTEQAGVWQLFVMLPDFSEREFEVNSDWMVHQNPTSPGWIVVGADGQLAFSASKDFEPTFTKDAVVIQKEGKDVFSREHLFERDAKGRLVPKADVVIDEPVEPTS